MAETKVFAADKQGRVSARDWSIIQSDIQKLLRVVDSLEYSNIKLPFDLRDKVAQLAAGQFRSTDLSALSRLYTEVQDRIRKLSQ